MKRLALLLCLLFSVLGCSPKRAGSSVSTPESDEAAEIPELTELVEFDNISFSIPSTWDMESASEETVTFVGDGYILDVILLGDGFFYDAVIKDKESNYVLKLLKAKHDGDENGEILEYQLTNTSDSFPMLIYELYYTPDSNILADSNVFANLVGSPDKTYLLMALNLNEREPILPNNIFKTVELINKEFPENNVGSTDSNPDSSDVSTSKEEVSNQEQTEVYQPTTGEKNCLSSAKSYLSFSAFSKSGLYDQLLYEGYTESECDYAVENCGANWNEQALKEAESYLDYSSFSSQGLFDQLIFEGFTEPECSYALNHIDADWNEQAAMMAQSYLDYSDFSRQELIDQLIFEGFSPEQAEYGTAAVGY